MSTTAAESWHLGWALALLVGTGAACAGGGDGFDGPTDVAFLGDGTPIVSDGYVNTRVAVLARGGGVVRSLDVRGTEDGQLDLPHGLAVGPGDQIYVADRDNARVQVFSRDLVHQATWAGPTIGRPFALSVVGERVFVVDGGDQDPDRPAARVVVLDLSGVALGEFAGYGTERGALSEPHDLVVDARGRVFVAELGTGRVQRFSPAP
jgi:DNA-binding beta-propeller fold protein YncE